MTDGRAAGTEIRVAAHQSALREREAAFSAERAKLRTEIDGVKRVQDTQSERNDEVHLALVLCRELVKGLREKAKANAAALAQAKQGAVSPRRAAPPPRILPPRPPPSRRPPVAQGASADLKCPPRARSTRGRT